MLKILAQKWDENKNVLKEHLEKSTTLNSCEYLDIVKITFDCIFNHNLNNKDLRKLDVENITTIGDGNNQGTLLFLIPFDTYQPSQDEYLLTYVKCEYGESGKLQAIQNKRDSNKLTYEQVEDFMDLCEDIIADTIKPYDYSWRKNWYFSRV